MRSIFCTLLFVLPLVAMAQQGSVVYGETVKVDLQLPPEMQHMRDQLPTQNTTQSRLLFDGAESLMTTLARPEQEEQLESETQGLRIRRIEGRGEEVIYVDRAADKRIEQRDFLGRTFLISDEPPAIAWRLTEERSEFLGRVCHKAVATVRDTVAVEAWFTPEIAAPVGPGPYGGLPGLILVLSEDEGRRTFVAKEVSLDPPAAAAIQPPGKGQKVSRKEFEATVAEKMKEMGIQGGANGTVQIRINRQ